MDERAAPWQTRLIIRLKNMLMPFSVDVGRCGNAITQLEEGQRCEYVY